MISSSMSAEHVFACTCHLLPATRPGMNSAIHLLVSKAGKILAASAAAFNT